MDAAEQRDGHHLFCYIFYGAGKEDRGFIAAVPDSRNGSVAGSSQNSSGSGAVYS